jgi:hypothetical protein
VPSYPAGITVSNHALIKLSDALVSTIMRLGARRKRALEALRDRQEVVATAVGLGIRRSASARSRARTSSPVM